MNFDADTRAQIEDLAESIADEIREESDYDDPERALAFWKALRAKVDAILETEARA